MAQMLSNATNVQPNAPKYYLLCKHHKGPTLMPNKRYKHSECHKNDGPKCLINTTNTVNLTNVHPKHFLNNTNTVNATKTFTANANAVKARRVPP